MVKKVIGCLRQYKKVTIATIVLTAIETLLEIVVRFLQATMIDEGIYAGNRQILVSRAWHMIACIAIALICGLLSSQTASIAASGLARNMRTDMYNNIQDFSFVNIDKFSTAGLVTRLTTDVINIQSAFMMIIRVAVRAPFMIIFALVMAFTINSRIAEVLDEKSSLVEKPQAIDVVKNGEIVFDGVSFNYFRDKTGECIHNINLTIPSGATVGVIGATGSGKSSLVQLIPRLYDVIVGKVLVGGIDVRDYKLDTIRNSVSMVLQKNLLFSGTIKENLRWGDENATDEELIHACQLAQADEFISQFPKGYDTYIEQGGTNVSGGQKQRLCIARALLKKPKILILDDSTSAVDTKTDALIRKAFREEIPDTTKLIIAQRISSVQDADFTVVLKDGYIDGVGNHEYLLEHNELYKNIYTLQQQGGNADEQNK
ncbi:MAG: ABC transporter ATP-binding protein [Clostridiales bacterium]|nr:MAG: ABC transporter ATP-binding protein [Clostridiales bacterium]